MLSREKDNAREDFESSEGLNFNGDMGQNFPGSPPHLSPVDSALDTLDEVRKCLVVLYDFISSVFVKM